MPAPGLTTEYKWTRYLPVADDYKEPDLEDCDHVEPSSRVDPTKELQFLASATSVIEISPEIGTEIRGLQLSALSPEELDELSLLLGRRALIVFRGQDFAELSFERQKEIVSLVSLWCRENTTHVDERKSAVTSAVCMFILSLAMLQDLASILCFTVPRTSMIPVRSTTGALLIVNFQRCIPSWCRF